MLLCYYYFYSYIYLDHPMVIILEQVKVLGIHSSPRKYGESYKLLRIALEAARREGAEVDLVYLGEYDIKPCIGCVSDDILACRFPCVIEDDSFNTIGRKMLEYDGYIISTPVYWYSVSGILKNFIDRLTSMENMIYHTGRSYLEGKVAGFIAVGNDTGALATISWLMVTMVSMGVHVPAWSLAYHEQKTSVESNRAALLDAANVGRVVTLSAKLLKSQKAWYDTSLDEVISSTLPEISREVGELEKEQRPLREKLWGGRASS